MSNGDGKTNPFGDGKSGAVGNSGGGSPMHRGPDRPQKSGMDATINTDSIPPGGRILKLDPPSDRQGLVGQTATSAKVPFKLKGEGPSMPATNADDDQPVGDVDSE